jgi:cullin 1
VGISKLIRILESEPDTCFTAAEYMNLYTTTYNMCTQKPPHEYSAELYTRYKAVFESYLTDTVRQCSFSMCL